MNNARLLTLVSLKLKGNNYYYIQLFYLTYLVGGGFMDEIQ